MTAKAIRADVRFTRPKATAPALVAEDLEIHNANGVDLILNITYNPEVGSKTFNVHVRGVGPICRLDVDGTVHGDAGRSHKHALLTERCPDRNLRDGVQSRQDLSGRSVREVFAEFCALAQIAHTGNFDAPDEDDRS